MKSVPGKEKQQIWSVSLPKKTLTQVNIRWKKGDWVNLKYKISTRKKKQQTGSVSLPKRILKQVNIRWK